MKERWVFTAKKVGFGYEGREVQSRKKTRRRVEEKSKNRNFGESSRVGLSLFQAFAMEKDSEDDQSFQLLSIKQGEIFSEINLSEI